ncbi:MAG: metallophosphoesterase family protein [Butyrivibrio sp.]|nr:metallophosphoesterase family protein [Butyrivibrio sp.]
MYFHDIAVLSDIHANHTAFQTCVDYCMAKGITNFILLGDYVSDCPNPQKTMELIHTLRDYFQTWMVRGNREEYLLSFRAGGEKGWKPGSGSGSLLYTYENLTDRDFKLFASLPIYAIWKEKGCTPFEYCHGSPDNVSGQLFRDKRNTKRTLAALKTDYLLHGHNHTQDSYSYRGKRSINPGSVGIPWSHGGKTQFAILHSGGRDDTEWEEELIQLDYKRSEIL